MTLFAFCAVFLIFMVLNLSFLLALIQLTFKEVLMSLLAIDVGSPPPSSLYSMCSYSLAVVVEGHKEVG